MNTAPENNRSADSTPNTQSDREYDVVVYGATGFVGTLVAEYLAQHSGSANIALAGRNQNKLEKVREEIAQDTGVSASREWPLLVADSFDAPSLRDMANKTKVVISTVGPYTRYGEELVRACAEAGTHYVDLCGEALFMHRTITKFHSTAEQSGARIVHACGFDSIPSDIGMLMLHEAAKESGEPLTEATMLVKMKGGLSGGTIDSMRVQTAEAKKDSEGAKAIGDPYGLSADRSAEPSKDDPELGSQPDFGIINTAKHGGPEGWAGPFLMAGSNTRVVRRSNSLLDHAYGPRLRYAEYQPTGAGLKGRLTAFALAGALGLGFTLLNVDKLRPLLSRWVPEPGDGPSKESRESGFFKTTHYGTTESGKRYTSTVSAQGDPGYKATCAMLSEAALTLALDQDKFPQRAGGILTPATALGTAYVDRLRAAGFSIESGAAK